MVFSTQSLQSQLVKKLKPSTPTGWNGAAKETTRISGGISWAVLGGLSIGLPPVVNFGVPGDRALQTRCIKELRRAA